MLCARGGCAHRIFGAREQKKIGECFREELTRALLQQQAHRRTVLPFKSTLLGLVVVMSSVGGGCPYKPNPKAAPAAPAGNESQKSAEAAPPSRCPVKPADRGKVYNVYSQEINPDNNMPANPNQLPRETQAEPLSTARVKSTIPKGGTDGTWTYPSPQMFYNALKRKGKGEDVEERHMSNVVAVHNSMNEQTWNQILKWEAVRPSDHSSERPSLLRFIGRPHDISPKAWFLSKFTSKPEPFDRHDWTVQRGDEEVRYVIDYYYMDDGVGGNTTMPLTSTGAFDKGSLDEKLIYVDARPALDSWSGFVARAKAFFGLAPISDPWVASAEQQAQPQPQQEQVPLSHSLDVDPSSMDERFRPEALKKMEDWIQERCAKQFHAMSEHCQGKHANEEKCQLAAFSLRLCTAQVICQTEATEFLEATEDESSTEADVAARWENVENCMQAYTQQAMEATATQHGQQQQQQQEV